MGGQITDNEIEPLLTDAELMQFGIPDVETGRAIERAALRADRARRLAQTTAPMSAEERIDRLFRNPLTPYGLLVRALRCVANATLMDMSRSIELSPAHLSSMEFGRRPLDGETLAKVIIFFGERGLHVPISLLHRAATDQRAQGGE